MGIGNRLCPNVQQEKFPRVRLGNTVLIFKFCADSDEDVDWKPALAKRPRLDKLKLEATEYKPVVPVLFHDGEQKSSSRNPDTREHYRSFTFLQ
jgi:hypothetical protein